MGWTSRLWMAVAVVLAAAVAGLPTAAAGPAAAVRGVQRAAPGPGGAAAQGRAGPADPVPAVAALWPVGVRPVVVRGWEPPATEYGPGHRGVDLAAAAGAPVRAVAPGRVSFAGRVAGRGVIAVELDGTGDPPLRTTYEPVRAQVEKGDEVAAGQIIGTVEAGGSHCPGTACLHWGLRRGDLYLNPLSLLPPWLLHRGPSRLLPVAGVPLPAGARWAGLRGQRRLRRTPEHPRPALGRQQTADGRRQTADGRRQTVVSLGHRRVRRAGPSPPPPR